MTTLGWATASIWVSGALRRLVAVASLGLAVAATGCGSNQAPKTATGSAAGRPPKIYHVEATPDDVRFVQSDVRKRNDAFYAGDFTTLVAMTYPGLIERSGGVDKAAAAMRGALAQSTARGVKVESLDFPDPPAFLKTTVREYVLIPTRKVMSVGDKRAEVVNFEFGVRAIGDPVWTYVDGPQITPANLSTLFADFPPDCPLPVISKKDL